MKNIILSIMLLIICTGLAMAQSYRDEGRSSTNGAGVPTGAVMPFDLGGRCPAGWSKWNSGAGRVIVGTGKYDGENYTNKQTGGEAKSTIYANNVQKGFVTMSGLTVKVKENQTPPYVLIADTSTYSEECVDRTKHCPRYPSKPFSVEVGEDEAEQFDNRQPFIALTYCRKN